MTKTNNPKPTLTAPNWLKKVFRVLELLSPSLTSRLATHLFFTPIRFKTPKNELKFYNTAERSSLKYKGKKVQIYKWGNSKQAVLLVHGWAGRGTQVAHLSESLLAAGYQVYTFDAPAHGHSAGKKTNLIEFGELIAKITQKYTEINSIIGHSMGGTASIYALTQGVTVEKCIVIGTPAYTEWILSSFCDQINVSTRVETLMKNYMERKLNKTFDELNNSSMVQKISTEGLIIHCKDDVDTPFKDAKVIHQNWKNSTLVLTNGLGHRRILKNKEIAQNITDFLKTQTCSTR